MTVHLLIIRIYGEAQLLYCVPAYTQIFVLVISSTNSNTCRDPPRTIPPAQPSGWAPPGAGGRGAVLHPRAVQLQVCISCLACHLWHADLSFLWISQLAATEPISKALPTFHGSKACVYTARVDCQHR